MPLPIPAAAIAVIVFITPRSPAARLSTVLSTHAICGATGLLLGALLPDLLAAGAAAAVAAGSCSPPGGCTSRPR